MKATSRKLVCTSAFALLAGAVAPAHADQVLCGKTNDIGEKRACAAAAQGVADLRQFIQRTRGIYILRMQDFEGTVPAYVARRDDKAAPTKEG